MRTTPLVASASFMRPNQLEYTSLPNRALSCALTRSNRWSASLLISSPVEGPAKGKLPPICLPVAFCILLSSFIASPPECRAYAPHRSDDLLAVAVAAAGQRLQPSSPASSETGILLAQDAARHPTKECQVAYHCDAFRPPLPKPLSKGKDQPSRNRSALQNAADLGWVAGLSPSLSIGRHYKNPGGKGKVASNRNLTNLVTAGVKGQGCKSGG